MKPRRGPTPARRLTRGRGHGSTTALLAAGLVSTMAPAAFVDAGRVWTELDHSHPDLDGTGLGIKYGIGGSLRLQEGQTFVVRADLAWSPDARPIGAYFAAGEIF